MRPRSPRCSRGGCRIDFDGPFSTDWTSHSCDGLFAAWPVFTFGADGSLCAGKPTRGAWNWGPHFPYVPKTGAICPRRERPPKPIHGRRSLSPMKTDWKSVASKAISEGLVKPPPKMQQLAAFYINPPPKKRKAKMTPEQRRAANSTNMKRFRDARKAQGLNTGTGEKLVVKKRPELAGIKDRREYLRGYERLRPKRARRSLRVTERNQSPAGAP